MKRVLVFLLCALAFSVGISHAALEKGPYLQLPTTTSMTVCFEGSALDSLPGEVRWGTDENNLTNVISGQGNKRRHEILIDGLQPNTKYWYEIQFGNEVSDTYYFYTAPEPEDPFTFLVVGDNRTDHQAHEMVVNAMINNSEHEPRLVVNSGDLIDTGGSTSDWQFFFDIEQPLIGNVPLLAAFGNHEIGGESLWVNFFEYPGPAEFGERVYSYKYGNVKFITIDSNTFANDTGQQVFLEDELFDGSQDPDIDHMIVNLHHPIYSTSRWGSNIPVQQIAQPLIEQYGVKLVFTGHDHIYQHCMVNDVHYMVIGGGGAPLYNYRPGPPWLLRTVVDYHYATVAVNGPQMIFKSFLASDNSLIEEIVIGDTPVATPTPVTVNTPTPTPIPGGNHGVNVQATDVQNGPDTNLKVDVQLYNEKTGPGAFTLYAVMELGGAFYNVIDFSPGITGLGPIPLPAGTDTGMVTLQDITFPTGDVSFTLGFYAALADAQGDFGDGVTSSSVTIP